MLTDNTHCLKLSTLPQSSYLLLMHLPFSSLSVSRSPFASISLIVFLFLSFFFFFSLSLIGLRQVCLDRPIHHSTILRDKPSGSNGEIDRVRREGDRVCRLSTHFSPLFPLPLYFPLSLVSLLGTQMSVLQRKVGVREVKREGMQTHQLGYQFNKLLPCLSVVQHPATRTHCSHV